MAAFNKFQPFVGKLGTATFNFGSDVLKAMLTNTQPTTTSALKSDVTDISAGNGYTAGGATLTVGSWNQSAGTAKLTVTDQSFTASGGSIADFRWVVLYDDSAGPAGSSRTLIGFYDYGATVTITVGNSFLIDFDGTNGVFQLA